MAGGKPPRCAPALGFSAVNETDDGRERVSSDCVTVERKLVAERKREHGQTRHYVSDPRSVSAGLLFRSYGSKTASFLLSDVVRSEVPVARGFENNQKQSREGLASFDQLPVAGA